MPQYLAFLRAINVGGHTVKMDHLGRLFETLSFANIETVIVEQQRVFS
ncbi:DUF1697 domain-containing protein [candidate division KSB1 bacterium]|nr:DUF1697 domain-containing protein [candidate division KSB1 bacterium]